MVAVAELDVALDVKLTLPPLQIAVGLAVAVTDVGLGFTTIVPVATTEPHPPVSGIL